MYLNLHASLSASVSSFPQSELNPGYADEDSSTPTIVSSQFFMHWEGHPAESMAAERVVSCIRINVIY